MKLTISVKIVFASLILMLMAAIMGISSIRISSSASSDSRKVGEALIPGTRDIVDVYNDILTAMYNVLQVMTGGNEDYYENALMQFKEGHDALRSFEELINQENFEELIPDAVEHFPALKDYYYRYEEVSLECMKLYKAYQRQNSEFYNGSETLISAVKQLYRQNGSQTPEAFSAVFDITGGIYELRELYAKASASKNAEGPISEFIKRLKETEKDVNVLKRIFPNEDAAKIIETIASSLNQSGKTAEEAFKTLSVMNDKINIRMDVLKKLRETTQEIEDIIMSKTMEATTTATSNLISSMRIQIFTLACIFIIGAAIMVFNYTTISKPLKRFVLEVGNLTSGDGDLTKRIAAKNRDELAELAVNFNKFIENVQMIVKEVKSSTDEVASVNSQLAATMEELSTTFDSQAKQVSQIAEDTEHISGISRSAAEALNKNNDTLQSAEKETVSGQQQLDCARESVDAIKTRAEALAVTIGNLSESSHRISDILVTINDIADQTNLLALNAAIEAARAGEAGRGFAVVADEVRKLAERTQKATGEIDEIITSLQSESKAASKEMNGAADSVRRGVEIITETTEGFKRVVESVTAVKADSDHVYKSVEEQYGTVQSVSDSAKVIAAGIEESNAAVNEVTATVSHLQKRTEDLKQIINLFKV